MGIKNYLKIIATSTVIGLVGYSFFVTKALQKVKAESIRHESNYKAATDKIDTLKLENGNLVTIVKTQELTIDELNNSELALLFKIKKLSKELSIKDKELKEASVATIETTTEFTGIVRDSVRWSDSTLIEYLKYKDAWTNFYYEKNKVTQEASIKIATKDTAIVLIIESKAGNWKFKNIFSPRTVVREAVATMSRPNAVLSVQNITVERNRKRFRRK